MNYPASAKIEQYGYPPHPSDSGPLMPTSSGGLICGKCHLVITEPDFGVLRLARAACAAAGEKPFDVSRPSPDRLVAADLSANEKKTLLSVNKGNGMRATPERAASLLILGLVEEVKTPGMGVTSLVIADIRPPPETILAFDLGPPDPASAERIRMTVRRVKTK